MSQDNTDLASAISIADNAESAELVALPTTMFNALLAEVHRLAAVAKEHEARLDKHSEYITDLRFRDEPEPTPRQRDRKEVLIALLTHNQGKMFAKDARQRMGLSETVFSRLLATMPDSIEIRPFHADRKRHILILRAAKG